MRYYIIFILSLLVINQSCHSVDRLYSGGQDEKVIERVIKLAQRGKANKKDIQFLEQSYQRKQDEVLTKIQNEEQRLDDDRWLRIYALSHQLITLQDQIKQITPLRAKNGYTAQFNFADIQDLEREAAKKSSDYYVNRGDSLLSLAQNHSNKLDARAAYDNYKKALNYVNQSITESKMADAKKIGTIKVATQVGSNINYGPFNFPGFSRYREYNASLQRIVSLNQSFWVDEVPLTHISKDEVDLVILLGIRDIDFNYEEDVSQSQRYSKTIKEVQTDGSGNSIKDSLGRPVYISKTVYATVDRKTRSKRAVVQLDLQLFDINELHPSFQRYYDAGNRESQSVCTIYGDQRAVPNNVTCSSRYGNFSSDQVMVKEALRDIRNSIQRDIDYQIDHYK